LDRLAPVLEAVRERWPGIGAAQHAITMTAEMVDLFANREDGVRRIAAALARSLSEYAAASQEDLSPHSIHYFAGDADWCPSSEVANRWEAVASANWLATARHAALLLGDGLLVDIGSTTTDLIAFKSGRVVSTSRTDAQRLASGELVYTGVVRTPLCALTQRIDWRGAPHNVMKEFFATSADVYRLLGELNPVHDLYPSADNAPKDLPATRQRLARMVGLDEREGTCDDWLACARCWRAAQVAEIGGQLHRVIAAHGLGPEAVVVSAGCGDFLVSDVLASAGLRPSAPARRVVAYGQDVACVAAHAIAGHKTVRAWAQVCAPCVAVAALFDLEHQ
jgi:probable H4MPT-linked C1 transfer pathway protein